MRVLVTNGETRPALAVTRSLGRLGHDVIVAAERRLSLASVSRFCADCETNPGLQHGADAFVEVINDIVMRRNIELLLPINEVTTWLLAEHRRQFPSTCVLPLPATDSLRIVNDKSRVLALAVKHSIPAPQTYTVHSADEALGIAKLRYPIVIKAARSRVLAPSGLLSVGVDYAANSDELAEKLNDLPAGIYPMLLQERIVGAGVGLFACYQHGRPVAFFSHLRLREKPPSGGVSVLCESTALDPTAVKHTQRLLSELRWHGVAMVEFKRDERDGTLFLMEINGRFWGSLQLAIDAGVDFPSIVASMASDKAVVPVNGYRTGIRLRWFLGDLDALFAILFRSSKRLNLPPGHPGRFPTLLRFLRLWQCGQRNEVFRLDDPRPGLLELWQWLRGR